MSLTTRRLEMELPSNGTSLEPTDVYYIDFEALTDDQIAQMRSHKAQLIRKYRKLARKRIGLRCQSTGRPIEQMSDKSFVGYMISFAFPYETPDKR
jgi:hypothetical protein